MNITEKALRDIVDWVIKNRRGMAFKEYPPNKIANCIKDAIKHDVFVFSHTDRVINGIACGERNDEEQYIFIHDVLTTQPGIVKKFILYCYTKYPSYAIYGMAHGHYRLINNPTDYARKLK